MRGWLPHVAVRRRLPAAGGRGTAPKLTLRNGARIIKISSVQPSGLATSSSRAQRRAMWVYCGVYATTTPTASRKPPARSRRPTATADRASGRMSSRPRGVRIARDSYSDHLVRERERAITTLTIGFPFSSVWSVTDTATGHALCWAHSERWKSMCRAPGWTRPMARPRSGKAGAAGLSAPHLGGRRADRQLLSRRHQYAACAPGARNLSGRHPSSRKSSKNLKAGCSSVSSMARLRVA